MKQPTELVVTIRARCMSFTKTIKTTKPKPTPRTNTYTNLKQTRNETTGKKGSQTNKYPTKAGLFTTPIRQKPHRITCKFVSIKTGPVTVIEHLYDQLCKIDVLPSKHDRKRIPFNRKLQRKKGGSAGKLILPAYSHFSQQLWLKRKLSFYTTTFNNHHHISGLCVS